MNAASATALQCTWYEARNSSGCLTTPGFGGMFQSIRDTIVAQDSKMDWVSLVIEMQDVNLPFVPEVRLPMA